MHYLSSIDAFGIQPSLLIKKKPKHKSFFGGVLSILLGFLLAFCMYYFGRELVLKESPSVNLSSEFQDHPSKLSFFNRFEFLISLQDSEMIPTVNEKIYYAKAFVFQTYRDEAGNKKNRRLNLNVETCDKVFTPEHSLYQYVKHLTLSNFYCISHNQSADIMDKIYINDYWGTEGFQMLQIKFYDCMNQTDEQGIMHDGCAPIEEVRKFLNYTQMSMYSFEEYVQTKKHKDPISHGYKEYFYYTSNRFFIAITQYLRKVKMVSDEGIIFQDKQELDSFKHDHMFSYTNSLREVPNFMSLSIQLTNEEDGYQRDYIKLADLAGQIGGIYKVLFLIFVIISHFYNENSMYEGLFNLFFEVVPDKGNYSIDNSYNNGNDYNKYFSSEENETKLKTNNIKNESLINNKKKQLELSFSEKLITLVLCKKCSIQKDNRTRMLFYNGKDKICSYLETSNYLLKIHQVDMLKKIISANENIQHTDYLSTPLISFDENKERYSILFPSDIGKKDNNIPDNISLKNFNDDK